MKTSLVLIALGLMTVCLAREEHKPHEVGKLIDYLEEQISDDCSDAEETEIETMIDDLKDKLKELMGDIRQECHSETPFSMDGFFSHMREVITDKCDAANQPSLMSELDTIETEAGAIKTEIEGGCSEK